MTLAELAARLGCRLEGDGAVEILRVASLEDAGPGDVSFFTNSRYASQLATTRASALVAGESLGNAPCAVLRSANPYLTLAEALTILSPQARAITGISPLSEIHPTAQIGPDVAIGAFVVVGPRARLGARTTVFSHVAIGADVTVGCDCLVHAHVSIRERVSIGDRVVIQDAAVIGSDGFGFAHRDDGTHQKIPQHGGVVIEDDVEIGAHTAIDRPAVGETRIGAGTKIDNLVMIAHGVKVGRDSLLAAQSGVAGSTVLDDHVTLAGQAGTVGHVHVGRGVTVAARGVVTHDIESGRTVAGFPAVDMADWRHSEVLVRQLPAQREQLKQLEARLAALEARLKTS